MGGHNGQQCFHVPQHLCVFTGEPQCLAPGYVLLREHPTRFCSGGRACLCTSGQVISLPPPQAQKKVGRMRNHSAQQLALQHGEGEGSCAALHVFAFAPPDVHPLKRVLFYPLPTKKAAHESVETVADALGGEAAESSSARSSSTHESPSSDKQPSV